MPDFPISSSSPDGVLIAAFKKAAEAYVKTDWNFAHDSFRGSSDIEMFFGPLSHDDPNDQIEYFTNNESLAHLMSRAGMFSSVKEARRNGWNKQPEKGWNEYRFKKRGRTVYVLGPTPRQQVKPHR